MEIKTILQRVVVFKSLAMSRIWSRKRRAAVFVAFALVIVTIITSCLAAQDTAPSIWHTGSMLHPVSPPRAAVIAQTQRLPADARDHVYVFLVNGLDPQNVCNFHGLYEYVLALGYTNVYFGQMGDNTRFVEQIREIRQTDPRARVVLLGYSLGANVVRRMAQALATDGTQLDMLIYLAGDTLRNTPDSRPVNVTRVINVRAWGLVFLAGGVINGSNIARCENYDLGFVRHSCVPTNQQLLEMLARELVQVATTVPPLEPFAGTRSSGRTARGQWR